MPDLLTPAELAAIAEREAKATEGPWMLRHDGWTIRDSKGKRQIAHTYGRDGALVEQQVSDAEFIAEARADIPALLRHIAALEARTPAPADDPELDGTDFAHPAWWRGHEHTTAMFCHAVNEILDGKDDGVGVNAEGPWCDTRKRLLVLMGKPAPALPADMEALLADAERLRLTLQVATKQRNLFWNQRDAERARAEKAEAERDAASLHVQRMKASTQWDTVQTISEQLSVAESNVRVLTADLAAARKELAGLGPVEREQASPNIDMWWPERVTDLECRTNRRRAIRRVLEGGAS